MRYRHRRRDAGAPTREHLLRQRALLGAGDEERNHHASNEAAKANSAPEAMAGRMPSSVTRQNVAAGVAP
jgi:hypothetical protein